MLRRLLLLPLLAPLLAVLLVSALNPRPWVRLRLLTWSAPPLPLGAWIALAGAGGAALSAGATGLALGAGAAPLRRQVRRRVMAEVPEPWEETEERESEPREGRSRPWGRPLADWAAVGGSRAPGEPAPTVTVPFRVLRRGDDSGAREPAPTASASARDRDRGGSRGLERMAEPVPVDGDWGTAASDEW